MLIPKQQRLLLSSITPQSSVEDEDNTIAQETTQDNRSETGHNGTESAPGTEVVRAEVIETNQRTDTPSQKQQGRGVQFEEIAMQDQNDEVREGQRNQRNQGNKHKRGQYRRDGKT